MFKIAVNNLVQSIGDDVYLPSPSAAASKNLSPLSLVERKTRIFPCTKDYYSTDFTLQDAMEDGEVEVELKPDETFCTFNRESTVKVDAMLSGYLKGIFDAGVRKVDEITIRAELGELIISEVNMQSLLDCMHSRRLKMEHALVRELSKKNRRALCVVTGVVKTTEPTKVSATLNASFNGNAEVEVSTPSIPKPTDIIDGGVIGGELKGTHEKNSIRTLELPAGTILAYEVLEMAVDKKGRVQLMVAHHGKGGFNKASFGSKPSDSSSRVSSDMRLRGRNNIAASTTA